MRDDVQLQQFDDSQYHRPNQAWVCGASDHCANCPGPNKNGSCAIGHCNPKRSLRQKRKIFTIAVTSLTVGLLVIIFASNRRNELISPGPLTTSHGQILNGEGAMRCDACHQMAHGTLGSWVNSVFGGQSKVGPTQSELCLKCHGDEFGMEHALKVHNVSSHTIQELSAKHDDSGFDVRNIVSAPNQHGNDVACSTCHREHHGSDHDLKLLTDQQCQSCHAKNYHSFERDHPEFTDWPFVSTRTIAFDHASHMNQHFPSKGKSMDCRQCHVSDATGNVQRLKPFSQSCAECHEQQITASLGERQQLLALPMLDLEALREANISIGQWPDGADGDFDGSLSPLSHLLLSADREVKEILQRLPQDYEFADVDPQNRTQLEDAGKLAWAIKQLLYDLAEDSESTIQKRLKAVIGEDIDPVAVNRISSQMHSALFREAQRYWMPRLAMEMQLKKSGQRVETIAWTPQSDAILARQQTRQDEELAPNPLKNKPEFSKNHHSNKSETVNSQHGTTQENRPIQNHAEKHQGSPVPLKRNGSDGLNDSTKPEDLLAKNPLAELLKNPNAAIEIPKQPIVEHQPSNPASSVGQDHPSEDANERKRLKAIAAAMRQLTNSGHSRWVRNDLTMSIDYVPQGHADPVITAWYEIAVAASHSEAGNKTLVASAIKNPASSWSTCASCHNVDGGKKSLVAWHPVYRDTSTRSWTHFSHGPHLVQSESSNCTSCHLINEQVKSNIQLASTQRRMPISDFKPILKSNCASCHKKEGASNSCSTCHSYHIGSHIRAKVK